MAGQAGKSEKNNPTNPVDPACPVKFFEEKKCSEFNRGQKYFF